MAINNQFGTYSTQENDTNLIDVTVGVYFDGTSNNRKNIEGRRQNPDLKNSWLSNKDGAGTSFGNDNTNVDKLEEAYPKEQYYFSIYVEGIGTKNPDQNDDGSLSYYGDFTKGQGLGEGETGLFEKVEKGCKDLVQNLQKAGFNEINILTIDAFGFSRGAAAARIFVNEFYKKAQANDPKSYNHGYLGKAFQELNYSTLPKTINMRLLGIYDTVSSYGLNVFDDIEDDKVPLLLSNKVGYVAHLTAENEHRKKFPLTNIASAGARAIELTLPGVHSDIGGGYKNMLNEKDDPGEEVVLTEASNRIEHERRKMVREGWYKDAQMISGWYYLKGIRKNLSNEYSLVILNLMAEIGKRSYSIPWKYDEVLSNKRKYGIPDKLNSVKARIDDYAFESRKPLAFYTEYELDGRKKKVEAGEMDEEEYELMQRDHDMLMELRNKYLHNSASMDGVGMEPQMSDDAFVHIDANAYAIWDRHIIEG